MKENQNMVVTSRPKLCISSSKRLRVVDDGMTQHFEIKADETTGK